MEICDCAIFGRFLDKQMNRIADPLIGQLALNVYIYCMLFYIFLKLFLRLACWIERIKIIGLHYRQNGGVIGSARHTVSSGFIGHSMFGSPNIVNCDCECECLFVYECPAIGWRFLQGVPHTHFNKKVVLDLTCCPESAKMYFLSVVKYGTFAKKKKKKVKLLESLETGGWSAVVTMRQV